MTDCDNSHLIHCCHIKPDKGGILVQALFVGEINHGAHHSAPSRVPSMRYKESRRPHVLSINQVRTVSQPLAASHCPVLDI